MKPLSSLKERLNGWQRIGIVLSILWALGAGISTYNEAHRAAESSAKMANTTCIFDKLNSDDGNFSSCEQKRKENVKTWLAMENITGNVLVNALVPIPLGWLAGFILLYVVRAQIAGFRAVIPWKILGGGKKLFVIFCILMGSCAILCGITELSNLYTDTLVPASLAPFVDIMPFPPGDKIPASVDVSGTWTRTDLTNDTIANPLQTSKIDCNREERKCTEARAFVTGNVLSVDLNTYDIQSWTPTSIVFGDDDNNPPLGGCASETYSIDLVTKTVSGAGHLINQDTNKWCKAVRLSGVDTSKDNWTLLLSNGFNVYWELRKKARPLPLRLIQSLFGN